MRSVMSQINEYDDMTPVHEVVDGVVYRPVPQPTCIQRFAMKRMFCFDVSCRT